jgi:cell division transport system permease protein
MAGGLVRLVVGDPATAGIVPGTGAVAFLVALAAAATGFLAVLAICLGLAAGRMAEGWTAELAGVATVRVPPGPDDTGVRATLRVLETTPGVAGTRVLSEAELAALIAPWLGEGLPAGALPVPRLIEVRMDGDGPDPASLRARLAAEVPGAVYDDHERWRAPIVRAAGAVEWLAAVAVALTLVLTVTMVVLAARAALAANQPVIATLRLIGAADSFITRAFVRRFTARALAGAAAGTLLALAAVHAVPAVGVEGALLASLAPDGLGWLAAVAAVPAAGMAAFWATRAAARAVLSRLP